MPISLDCCLVKCSFLVSYGKDREQCIKSIWPGILRLMLFCNRRCCAAELGAGASPPWCFAGLSPLGWWRPVVYLVGFGSCQYPVPFACLGERVEARGCTGIVRSGNATIAGHGRVRGGFNALSPSRERPRTPAPPGHAWASGLESAVSLASGQRLPDLPQRWRRQQDERPIRGLSLLQAHFSPGAVQRSMDDAGYANPTSNASASAMGPVNSSSMWN